MRPRAPSSCETPRGSWVERFASHSTSAAPSAPPRRWCNEKQRPWTPLGSNGPTPICARRKRAQPPGCASSNTTSRSRHCRARPRISRTRGFCSRTSSARKTRWRAGARRFRPGVSWCWKSSRSFAHPTRSSPSTTGSSKRCRKITGRSCSSAARSTGSSSRPASRWFAAPGPASTSRPRRWPDFTAPTSRRSARRNSSGTAGPRPNSTTSPAGSNASPPSPSEEPSSKMSSGKSSRGWTTRGHPPEPDEERWRGGRTGRPGATSELGSRLRPQVIVMRHRASGHACI